MISKVLSVQRLFWFLTVRLLVEGSDNIKETTLQWLSNIINFICWDLKECENLCACDALYQCNTKIYCVHRRLHKGDMQMPNPEVPSSFRHCAQRKWNLHF